MKKENKSSSHGELFGCCFGGMFLKKIHFSSQEAVVPGEKIKLEEKVNEILPINPPPYSLHDNNKFCADGQDPDFLKCPGGNILDHLQIKAGGLTTERYIYDHDADTTYLLGKLLGKGGFAKCFELKDTKTQKVYAGKIISKLKLTKQRQKEKILHEITLHSTLRHRHVVDFCNSFEDDVNVYIILEFCSRKSLVHVLKVRQKLIEAEVRYFLLQLIDGIQYLQSQRVVHRDLKLGNMLLSDNMHVKIADFGLATKIEFPGEKKMTVCGTPNYIAPEVLQKIGHSYEVDIWAVGCIMYALLCGRPPFETNSLKETYVRISTNRYHLPSHLSSAAKRIICKLLQPDPERRPSLEQILHDDFFTSFFTPRFLPTSCCEVEPKFNARFQSKNTGRVKSHETQSNSSTNIVHGKKSTTKIPFISEKENNLKIEVDMKNGLSVLTSKPLSKFQNKSNNTNNNTNQQNKKVAGSLVPTNLESYCRSIKMIHNNKDSIGQNIEFDHLVKSIESSLDSKTMNDNLGVSRFSAIRLYRALSHCLESMPSDLSVTPLPIIQPLWVTKWVDYSNKYGFGFQLSDMSVGILFNDTTRMVLSSDGRTLTYNDLSNQTFVYATNLAPKEHRKKVTLLLYFSQYMDEHLIHGAEFGVSSEKFINGKNGGHCVESVFMRKWFRTDKAVVMHLSNGTLQVNFFDDHTKLILSVEEHDYLATYINNNRQSTSYRLLSITNFGCRSDIAERLKYARKMLEGVINLGGETV